MSEKEPRKRRRKKDGAKKDEVDEELFSSTKARHHQKEELSDSDGDVDDDISNEGNKVARCVFFVLFSLLVAASGIIYWSLQGAEKNLQDEVSLPPEFPAEHMHPWAQHEEKQTKEINFDSLYEESEYEDESGFFDSTLNSINDDMSTGEITNNEAVEASIASLDENIVASNEPSELIKEYVEPEPVEHIERENVIPEVSASIVNEITIQNSELPIRQNEEIPWTELHSEFQPSSNDHIVLEASIMSQPEDTSELQLTSILEEGLQAKSTENIVFPEPVHQDETSADTTVRSTTETDMGEEASPTVANTVAPINEENGEVPQPEPSTDASYENADITNEYDFMFREELDEADQIVQKSPEKALRMFDALLNLHPKSPRAKYGQAQCLDKLAEERRSNALLEQAATAYSLVLQQPDIPERLYLNAGERAANRMRFRGFVARALKLQREMTEKFPKNANITNQLAVSYLMAGKGQEAKKILKQVLANHPMNGFAKVHYGFILKTEDNKYIEAIKYLSEGINSREAGVIDGRFFFHLGDALARTNQQDAAMKVYEQGVHEGVFLSIFQRSLYNVDGLTGKPWWKPEETRYYTYIDMLEKHWETIRKEAVALMDSARMGFIPESEGLRDTGDWKQFEMFARGHKVGKNCLRTPQTCALLEKIPDAVGCKRGQIKFSIMQPGTHVWAHTGPTNCRLRSHLGLVVPKGPKLRVANETREWAEGKVLIFDDSFEHEVWHDGSSFRLILIVDFWHPELTVAQKKSLSPI